MPTSDQISGDDAAEVTGVDARMSKRCYYDLFEGIFGMGSPRGRSSRAERGADLRYNMEISIEEAFAGKSEQLRLPTAVACEACSGTGARAGSWPKTCPHCGGSGRVRHSQG